MWHTSPVVPLYGHLEGGHVAVEIQPAVSFEQLDGQKLHENERIAATTLREHSLDLTFDSVPPRYRLQSEYRLQDHAQGNLLHRFQHPIGPAKRPGSHGL